MNILEFYNLNSYYDQSFVRLDALELPINEPINGLTVGQRIVMGIHDSFSFPIKFKVVSGKKFGDLLDTTWGNIFLISDNLKNTFERNALTGWKSYPVSIVDKTGREIKGYHGLSVTGRCGCVDFKQSEIIEIQRLPTAPKARYYKGIYFGLDNWDGTDFFLPEGYFGIILTSTASEVINKNNFTNIEIINISNIVTPC